MEQATGCAERNHYRFFWDIKTIPTKNTLVCPNRFIKKLSEKLARMESGVSVSANLCRRSANPCHFATVHFSVKAAYLLLRYAAIGVTVKM